MIIYKTQQGGGYDNYQWMAWIGYTWWELN
jgi:hypothetical protein